MKTSRQIREEIENLAIKAKAVVETCKKEGREFTDDESTEFDNITEVLIPDLKKQEATALKREEAELRLANQNRRNNRVEELSELLESPPTNNRLAGNEDSEEDRRGSTPRVYHRVARLKAFKSDRDAYNAGMWMRAVVARVYNRGEDLPAVQHCRRAGLEITNVGTEGSGPAGGYLVPAPVSATIIEVRERVGVARQVCDIQPMTADTLTIPKRTGGLTVYYPDEAATITDSTKNWGTVGLTTRKRAVLAKISQELQDDALINIVDNLFVEMAYALALQEDNELINGTGAAAYGGVRGLLNKIGSAGVAQAAAGHDTWPELDLPDIFAAMSKLPDRFNRSPSWICSSNFYWAVFARLLAAGGGNGVMELQAGDGGRRTFFGVPVFTTSHMPTSTAAATNCALFGQFDMAAVLGDRTGIRIGRDDFSGFAEDVTTLKATQRTDINVYEPGDAASPGAYVALKTAA